VLKITIPFADEQRWSLQGQWSASGRLNLSRLGRSALHRGCAEVIVDLIEMTSIDRNGEAILAKS